MLWSRLERVSWTSLDLGPGCFLMPLKFAWEMTRRSRRRAAPSASRSEGAGSGGDRVSQGRRGGAGRSQAPAPAGLARAGGRGAARPVPRRIFLRFRPFLYDADDEDAWKRSQRQIYDALEPLKGRLTGFSMNAEPEFLGEHICRVQIRHQSELLTPDILIRRLERQHRHQQSRRQPLLSAAVHA